MTRDVGEAAVAAALSTPGVAGLHAGRFGEVALLLPGTRIPGLRSVERASLRGIEVHLVYDVDSGLTVSAAASNARAAVSAATGAPFVDVIVADAARAPAPRQSGVIPNNPEKSG
ncbi:hypothetical protein CAPI_01350 [Corynebacterium capitovis DSM 44611]|nr:hypothetical protein CAPI_01350 [Corynebacterium capitovis DSM 44611]